MHTLRAAITGNYRVIGKPEEADCVIGQSFGAAQRGPGLVNELLADYVVTQTDTELPWLLQQEIADALPNEVSKPALTIKGDPSTKFGSELDSWTVLLRAGEYMRKHDLQRPLLVAQAYHVGRFSL